LSKAFAAAEIEHVVSGAAAMAAHGYVRATKDIDILVAVPAVRLPRVFEIVRGHGFSGDDEDLIGMLRDRYVAVLRSGPSSVEILVPVLPYHRTLVERAVVKNVAGVDVPFVSIEDLVVLKMLWRRAKDVPDIHALLALAGEGFDQRYALDALRSILPEDDPRHGELSDWIIRFAGGRASGDGSSR
jgi:hypothetical protein